MTTPTTDTSREAAPRFAAPFLFSTQKRARMEEKSHGDWVRWSDYKALLAERDAALLREKSLKDSTEELRQLQREFNAVKWDRDTLRAQLAAARNEALEEAATLFDEEAAHDWGGIEYSSLVGVPISNAEDLRKSAKRAERNAANIRALKSTLATAQRCAECDCENGGSDCTWISTPAPRDGNMTSQATPITFTYKNYRGEVATRTAVPKEIWFGATEWHPEPGWLMTAYDLEKAADRDFALADCSFAPREVTPKEAARVLLDIARERYTENAKTRVCGPVEPWDRISDDVKKMWLWAVCADAIAQETDDE